MIVGKAMNFKILEPPQPWSVDNRILKGQGSINIHTQMVDPASCNQKSTRHFRGPLFEKHPRPFVLSVVGFPF